MVIDRGDVSRLYSLRVDSGFVEFFGCSLSGMLLFNETGLRLLELWTKRGRVESDVGRVLSYD